MININVLDTDFNIVTVIDTYESFIWTDRFREPGDFELYSGIDSNILNNCKQDYYLQINESPHMMIIDTVNITTDAEQGNHIRVTGKSLESIIDRRIIWEQTTVSNTKDHTLKTAIEELFKRCFGFGPQGTIKYKNEKDASGRTIKRVPYIRSTITYTIKTKKKETTKTKTIDVRQERVIPNLIYMKPDTYTMKYYDETDEQYYDITIDKTQYTGDNLYDIFADIFDSYSQYGLGYRILPLYSMKEIYTDEYIIEHTGLTQEEYNALTDYSMIFEIYTGVNRTYDQTDYPSVVFSPDYDNIINTDYYDSLDGYKNVTLVLGEGEGTSRDRLIIGGTNDDGTYYDPLIRRELYSDARDLQSDDYEGDKEAYALAMKQRGLEDLYECTRQVTYDGQVEAERTFVYGIDFIMGDVIEIKNEFGIEGKARVIEFIMNEDSNGRSFYPTFDSVELVSDYTEDETRIEEE